MKNDITKVAWYRGLVERCNNEPDKVHTVFIENTGLGPNEFRALLDDFASQLSLLPSNAKVMVNLDGMVTDLSKYKLLDNPGNVVKASNWGDQFQRRDITQTQINDINMEVRKADIDALLRRLSTKNEDFSGLPLVSDVSAEELEKIAMLSHEYTHLPPTRAKLEEEMPNYEEIQPASVEAKEETSKPTNVFHFNQGTEKDPKGMFDNNFFDTKVYRKLCELCSRNPKRLFKVYIDQGHLDDEVFKLYVRMYHDRMNREVLPNNLIVDFSGAMDKAYEEYTPEPFVDADKEWFKEFKKECENNPTVMCYKIVRQDNMPIGEFLNYVFTMQENLPENARIIRVINEEDRKIPKELEERFKKVDFTVTPPDENGEYKMFGDDKLRERRKMVDSKKLLPSQEEINDFLNSAIMKQALERCKQDPNRKVTLAISQDGLSDIEFRKRLNFLQYLRMENLIPSNLDFNVESKLGVYEYKPDEPKTMG